MVTSRVTAQSSTGFWESSTHAVLYKCGLVYLQSRTNLFLLQREGMGNTKTAIVASAIYIKDYARGKEGDA